MKTPFQKSLDRSIIRILSYETFLISISIKGGHPKRILSDFDALLPRMTGCCPVLLSVQKRSYKFYSPVNRLATTIKEGCGGPLISSCLLHTAMEIARQWPKFLPRTAMVWPLCILAVHGKGSHCRSLGKHIIQ
jgi:hypothetical protein